jgi:hypothetical protein
MEVNRMAECGHPGNSRQVWRPVELPRFGVR